MARWQPIRRTGCARTPDRLNARIDAEVAARLQQSANVPPASITQRIDTLDRQWDIERALEATAATLSLSGVLLGVTVNRRWLLGPAE